MRLRRDEVGMSLVEVLVALVVETIIVGALGMAFVGILNGTKRVNESLSRSGDARIAAAYIVSDARNSSGPEVALGVSTCTDASPPVSGTATPIVEFGWDSTGLAGATTAHIVDYILVSNSLLRRECRGASTVGVSDRAVATSVTAVTAVCSPNADCTGSPSAITVTVTELPDSTGAVFQYSLTGAFRKLDGFGAPGPPRAMFLFGAGGCGSGATGIKIAGGSKLRVYGIADVNAGDVAGSSGCKAMQIGTDAGNYKAGDTQILAGGSCAASGSSSCPTVTSYSPALMDPYAGLPALAGVPPGACTGSNPTPVANAYPPGVYPLTLSIPATATLSGTYIFCGGVSFTNGARVTGSNVLLYLKGGSLSESGDAAVSLTAAPSGAYAGVLVWQPKGNATTMSISNGGQLALNGAVYAHDAQVVFTGGSVTTTVYSIVSQMISLSGGASVTIGTASSTPLSIDPTPAVAWPVNTPYSHTTTATGGDGNYIWSATNLPVGLGIDPDTGTIFGTAGAVGSKFVTVKLNDVLGDDPDSSTYTFTIDALPTVTSTSPASRGQGATSQSVTITGTGFANGAGSAFSGTGITVNSTTFNSATSLTANITIAAGATIGGRNVTVINPDTGVGVGAGVFTVNAAPTVASTSPGSRGQGASGQNVLITGTGFVNGAGASFSGTGVTVNSTTWNSGTQVTANVTIAPNASVGARDVSVTNPDAGVGAGTGKFTVNAGPSVTAMNPASRPQGATNQGVLITGTGFVNGASASFSGTGVTVNSTTWNSATQVTANITIGAGAAVGARNVTVVNPDTGVDIEIGVFTVNAAPTVLSTGPASRPQGAVSQSIVITGTGFVSGAGAAVSGLNITVNSTTWNSATQVTANITIGAGAAVGARNVTVVNPDTGVGVGTGVFTVNAAPTVTSTSPASRGQGAAGQNIVITGTGFVSGTGLAASFSGSGITVNSTTFTSATAVTANITIAAGSTIGLRDVSVTNPDSGVGTGTGRFTVNAGPSVTSTSPASRPQGSASQTVVITGTGFVSGTGLAASFTGTGITVNSTTFTSATSVTANITVAAGATAGARDVTVTNPDTGVGVGSGVFTVNAAPTVASTSPASRGQGAVGQNVVITGTGFVSGAAATFSGTGITVNSTTFTSAIAVTANVTFASGATIGARDVTVTNPDTGVGTGTGLFTVNIAPTVTATSPAARGQGAASQSVVITGTGFVGGTGLAASFSGTGITVSSTTFTSATSVTANITLAANATTGLRDVTVTNADAGVGTGTSVFTVNTAPTVTLAAPASRGQGAASQSIVITGTGFVTGAAATFSGTGITVNSTNFTSATSVTANITLSSGATIGGRDVTVTNPDAGVGTGTSKFTVNTAPAVTSTGPASRGRGATNQNIVITGTGFVTGAAATFSGTGITVNSTTFTSATSVTANIAIAVGATTGLRNVTVTNPDAGVGTGTSKFTVNAGPGVTSLSPATHAASFTGLPVVITGTGFVSGATVLMVATLGTAPTVVTTTWNSATSITITITVASVTSTDNVVVTNPDGGIGTKVGGFTVT